MDTQTSGWFESSKSPEGWVYALRPTARAASLPPAFLLLVVALILAGTGCFWLSASRPPGVRVDGDPRFLILLAFVLLLAAMAIVMALLRQHAGRDQVGLDAGSISSTWHLGPISWPKTAQATITGSTGLAS